jgi:hypothetical protein
MTPVFRILFATLLLGACSGGSSPGNSAVSPTPAGAPAQVGLLFMGNSHTSVNGLPNMVAAMARAAWPGRTVEAVEAPGWMFLEERAHDASSLALLRSRPWRFVVLQAQEYSSSGLFDYPIDGAVELVNLARGVGALPILFPEWPRRGIPETQRIYDLHLSIARRAAACVPPIPQAFDLSLARHPGIVLHADDGNHSSAAGAFLAALVIATTMTGIAPNTLPDLEGFGVPADVQARLRSVAAETVLSYSPRTGCPADPPSTGREATREPIATRAWSGNGMSG